MMNKNKNHNIIQRFMKVLQNIKVRKKKKIEEDVMREESFKAVFIYAMWGAMFCSIIRFFHGFITFIKDSIKTLLKTILGLFRIR